jgi:hypothetical protein
MPDCDIINTALEKVPTGSLVKCDQVCLEVAIATADILATNAIGPAGSVGCLRRPSGVVVGFSSQLATVVKKQFKAKDLAIAISGKVANVQAPLIFFSYDILEPIRSAMGTERCAEKFIYSSRGGVPTGMAVIWYGGKADYKPDAEALKEFVPLKYDSISTERFQYMKPCDDCVKCSPTMMMFASS